jgi:hypothetical protein
MKVHAHPVHRAGPVIKGNAVQSADRVWELKAIHGKEIVLADVSESDEKHETS